MWYRSALGLCEPLVTMLCADKLSCWLALRCDYFQQQGAENPDSASSNSKESIMSPSQKPGQDDSGLADSAGFLPACLAVLTFADLQTSSRRAGSNSPQMVPLSQ